MISLADNRIPNLNPHAASFIPISIQNQVQSNAPQQDIKFVIQNETTDIYQCDVSSTYYPNSNTGKNFVKVWGSCNVIFSPKSNSSRLHPTCCNLSKVKVHLCFTPINNFFRDSSLTKFVETYQEFIPSSSVHKKLPSSVRVPTQLPQPPQSNQSESSSDKKESRSSPPSVR